MPDTYEELLEATIQHLESLKARGTKFISISEETLTALDRPVVRKMRTTGPQDRVTTDHATADHKPGAPKLAAEEEKTKPAAAHGKTKEYLLASPQADPAKETAFADLRRRALACVKCSHLASSRKNVVFGVGNINAELMFVGEAPGADEDIQGEPFVGRAGQLLTKIIETMGLTRDSVYIANILKCRPDTPGQAYGNRPPTPEEMQTCIPFLHEQVDLIKPKVLVALGGTAIQGLLGQTGVSRVRGNWQIYRGTPLMPTFHPSYLLRSPGEKRKAWEDMLKVMEKLGLSISEKQRGFFLKSA
jgi:uracil-DNA glycosylase family 4